MSSFSLLLDFSLRAVAVSGSQLIGSCMDLSSSIHHLGFCCPWGSGLFFDVGLGFWFSSSRCSVHEPKPSWWMFPPAPQVCTQDSVFAPSLQSPTLSLALLLPLVPFRIRILLPMFFFARFLCPKISPAREQVRRPELVPCSVPAQAAPLQFLTATCRSHLELHFPLRDSSSRARLGFDLPELVKLRAEGLLVLFLNHRIKRLEFSSLLSCSHGGLSDTPARCSVKCAKGSELLYLFDFDCRSLTRDFAHID
jgi:hypothetical protein